MPGGQHALRGQHALGGGQHALRGQQALGGPAHSRHAAPQHRVLRVQQGAGSPPAPPAPAASYSAADNRLGLLRAKLRA